MIETQIFISRRIRAALPAGAANFCRGVCVILAVALATVSARAAELFPFVLPWDDASASATNVSGWLDAPAGKGGFVSVKDGHLFANGKRLRIFGVNLAFGANFPTHDDAEKIAARMAKFGINCVRFHHMDWQTAPGGIWAKDMQTLDPGQLDRLDYFIAQLKTRGIYTDLNLHVSRTYPDRPAAEKQGNPNYDAGVDNFSPKMIALQKDYARALLTHVNPFTKNAYVDEPAVALIEINNENSLLTLWHWGSLDKTAAPYRAELAAMWAEWLRKKYGGDEKLAAAWAAEAKPPGAELLKILDADSFDEIYELTDVLRASSLKLYATLIQLADSRGRARAKNHELMSKAGIKGIATLYKQERWLMDLKLLEKKAKPGPHDGSSYVVHKLESLPLPEEIIEKFNQFLAERNG